MKKNATIVVFIIFIIIPSIIEPLYLHFIASDSKLEITFNSDFEAKAFNDSSENGCSVIHTFYRNLKDSSYTIKFTLKSCSAEPFAGIKFIHRNNKTFDLSGYDTVIVVARLNYLKDVCIDFRTPIKEHTVDSLPITYRFNRYDITCTDKRETTPVPFKELFHTPDFWFKKDINSHLTRESLGTEHYKKVSEIVIQNTSTETGKRTVLTIYKIELRKNVHARRKASFLICLFYYLSLGIICGIYLILRYRKKTSITDQPHPVEQEIVTDWMRIKDFMDKNYSKPIARDDIAAVLGLSPGRVTKVINEKTGDNFRTYLNRTRMAEAQRWLRDSDCTVAQICFKVGYNNVAHFNRVFKNLFGMQPLEYRSKHSDDS